jgi:hypothetical protein
MRRAIPLGLALLAGCATGSRGTGPQPVYVRLGALELSATIERDAGDLMGSVDVMNTGDRTISLHYQGSCAVSILVADGEGEGPRWDALTWWQSRPGICRTDPVVLEIPPQTLARILTPAVSEAEILGDSIASGSHPVALRIRILAPRDTTLLLPAGRVELAGSGAVLTAWATRPAIP